MSAALTPARIAYLERRHAERYWTPERIVASFQEFAHAMGRPPTVNDMNFRAPSRLKTLSKNRILEAERAAELGLRLPSQDLAVREFGSWRKALEAAWMQPNPRGFRYTQERPVYKTGTASQVCPSCGDLCQVIDAFTGWCRPCTAEWMERAA